MLYVEPPAESPALEDCRFYHSIDLPAPAQSQAGFWDLRATVDTYLGNFDFAGKRVLDVGTAGGFNAFAAEQRGAREVVALDMDAATRWEILPGQQVESRMLRRLRDLQRDRNGFWYSHKALGSEVLRLECDLYSLPPEIGRFDVAIVAMILPHLRDPLRALESIAPVADALIISQPMPMMPDAWAYFIPRRGKLGTFDNWWALSPDCLRAMVGLLGFEVIGELTASHSVPQRGEGAVEDCTALIAIRTQDQ